MKPSLRILLVLLLCAGGAQALAQNVGCSATMSNVAFGTVNPLSSLTTANATLNYSCTNSANSTRYATVCFSIGDGAQGAGQTNPREMQDGAADVLQPSVTKVGGIGEFRKVAALAAAANLPVVPHAFYYGPGLAASLHLAATLGGTMPIEFPTGEHEVPLLATPITPRDGWLDVPDGPGLGVELNEEVVRRFPYAAAGGQPFVLR